ncbi:MFS transporter [Legionella jamestowniensis]|uniref:MFS transporter n=1 Tax=Legionella jamestowniensis TaxID=455 RepID=UPI000B003955|nr:MFS transporter [Legionella jamestowniensis]
MKQGTIPYSSIAPCLLAIIVDALGFGLVYPVMTALLTASPSPVLPVEASTTLRHFYLGLSFMLYPFCMFFGTSFMGDLSDKYGRKTILMLCMTGIAISFYLMAIAIESSSILFLLIGRSLSGLMAGSQPIAQAAIADLSTAESKAKNMSIIALSYCIGSILGPLLGGVTSDSSLISWFDFSTPFFIAGTLAVIALVWLMLAFKETHLPSGKKTIDFTRPIKIFVEAFEHRNIRVLAIIFLFMQIGFSLYFQFIVVHMKYVYQYDNWQLGAIQGMLGLGFAVGLLIGMPFSVKRFKTINIGFVSLFITAIGQLLAAVLPIESLQWVLAIIIAGADIMAFTALLTLFSDSVSEKAQGWAMGIANAVMALSWAITGLGSNFLNTLGTQGLIFIGGICLILSGFILLSQNKNSYP